jgi:23S rRNA (pseudouridine1915-N3)-methyltransferase
VRLKILSIGKLSKGPEMDLWERYFERAKPLLRDVGFTHLDVQVWGESRKPTAQARKAEEALLLLDACKDGSYVFVLDERGVSLRSEAFAQTLQKLAVSGEREAVFIIGGPDGLHDDVLARARVTLSFGAATWPHQMVKMMLMEQIYRALTILSGHPYHRA